MLEHLTGSAADVCILEYIQQNLPEEAAVEVPKTKLEQVPEALPELI